MSDLHEKNCIPCRGGVLPFDISVIHKYLKKIDGWDVKKNKKKYFFLDIYGIIGIMLVLNLIKPLISSHV